MKYFLENRCRLCSKIFCCEKCRVQHEAQVHKVNSDCEICIYGRTTISEVPVSLLSHIKSAHWPLHCVFCKKVFTSFDDLIPHNKCFMRMETQRNQATPKTPVTPAIEKEEPSPEVTPFFKNIKALQPMGSSLNVRAVTSTPLVHKDEVKSENITPNSQSHSIIQKSNLKLTGSSILSDSKKSERRVTFSDTPSVAESSKKPKHLPLTKKSDECENESAHDSTDDSYNSVEDEDYKTAPTANTEDKENIENEILVSDKRNPDGTLWESAMTKLEINTSNFPESICNQTNNFNVSLQINVFNNTLKTDDSSNVNEMKEDDASLLNKSANLWTSMTNIVKSVVSNISMTAQNSFSSVSLKRPQPDDDVEVVPSLKRMKLTELKCRRPIREIGPLYQIRFKKPKCVDKATQTDESWMQFYKNNCSL